MSDLFSFLVITVCLGGACLLVLLSLLLISGQLIGVLRGRGAAERLAEELGLEPQNPERGGAHVYYGGTHNGRFFVIRPLSDTYRSLGRLRRRLKLEILLGLTLDHPPENTLRSRFQAKDPQTFADAFGKRAAEAAQVSASGQAALLSFVRQGHKTGLQSDMTLRLSPGVRDVLLFPRANAGEVILTHDILPSANTILSLHHPNTNLSGPELQQVLDELDQLARILEIEGSRSHEQTA